MMLFPNSHVVTNLTFALKKIINFLTTMERNINNYFSHLLFLLFQGNIIKKHPKKLLHLQVLLLQENILHEDPIFFGYTLYSFVVIKDILYLVDFVTLSLLFVIHGVQLFFWAK
jgi:hypothetical protein